jgi:hypothetical protein
MNIIENIKENQRKINSIIYLVCVVIIAVMAFRVYAYVTSPEDIKGSIEVATKKYQLEDEAVKTYQVKYTNAADELKKNNHLTPKAAKPNPPLCTGVIGNKALINGKLYSVGDEILGAKITDINPTGATIIWEGKPMQLAAFAKVNVTAPPAKQPDKKDTRHRVEKPKKRKPDVAAMPGPVQRQGGRGGRFRGMSREEMEAMKQKVMKMSPQERQKFMKERRAQQGGGRGGRRGR